MHVDSYLEIFTTMYGWAFANIIVSVITGTGLVVVPFFVIIFKKWIDAKEQGMQSAGILSLIESAQTRLIVALFVCSTCFFGAPFTSLKDIDLIHQPKATLSDPNPNEVSRDKGTNTGMDDGMADAKNIESSSTFKDVAGVANVPPWWYSVMAISSGINNAVRGGLSNFEENPMREIQATAQLTTLESEPLRSAGKAFYNRCYGQAKSLVKSRPELFSDDVKKAVESGAEGTTWMGGDILVNEVYDKIPIQGLKDFYPDTTTGGTQGATGQSAAPPQAPASAQKVAAGNEELYSPTCKDMWMGYGSQEGLLDRMANHSRKSRSLYEKMIQETTKTGSKFVAGLKAMINGKNITDITTAAKTAAVQTMLSQTEGIATVDNAQVSAGDYGALATVRNGAVAIGSSLGVAWNGFKVQMMRQPLLTGLPMAQALLLMGIYTFLPLAVFLSGYDLRALFLGTLALFTVKMFASMITIAQWMDAKLVDSMYPSSTNTIHNVGTVAAKVTALLTPTKVIDDYKTAILDTLLVGLLIGLPMLWVRDCLHNYPR